MTQKKKLLVLVLIGSVVLAGCNIRMIAVLETEDAVYGKTKVEKEQSYDPKKREHLTLSEAIAGTISPEIIQQPSTAVEPELPSAVTP